jgi:RNA polymerase sigma-70 factor (ECF subfamily)
MPTVTACDVTTDPLAQEFEKMFREHYRLVYRTAFGVTGSAEDAEDVLQTIFLRLCRRQCPPDFKKNPRAYLYRAAVNVSLTTIRSRKRHILTGDAEGIESLAYAADSPPGSENQNGFLEAVSALKPKAVEILVLRYVHNYTDAEIAKMLGTSRGTIAVSLFRSRARLKKLMRASSGGKS